jgi:hypothetical protein
MLGELLRSFGNNLKHLLELSGEIAATVNVPTMDGKQP